MGTKIGHSNVDQLKEIDNKRLVLVMVLYVFGLFIGALNTGIITPARTIIQGSLGVDDVTGIWMINIYTLAYAAAIPIAGKLADKLGRKYIFIISIFLFGLGSVICGLSSASGNFTMLLAGRAIQALGGGGIMPIATAEFGTSFPEEKRGMALGIIGGVYGIANILGSTAGSVVLNVMGNENWKWLFYINIPICFLIIVFCFIFLPNHKSEEVKKIDKLGTLVIVAMILSLLYGLKGVDFFNFGATITSTTVYPFLIAFVLMLPLFIIIEKKAEDPILNLAYFTNRQIVITLILSFIVGVSMMGMVFVPQFAENTLKIPTGTGGYFVAILGIFAGVAAPLSGNLIDKMGVKKIFGAGFAISVTGALFLIFVTIPYSSFITVFIGLILIGLGMGFTMGTPLNYMMLQNTKKEESNSSLAAISLIRSIGTAVSPAIMIGFIAQAGMLVQDNLMGMLPQPTAPKISQAEELTDYFSKLKENPKFAEMMGDVEIPDFSTMGAMSFDMSGNGEIPEDILDDLKTADVTNITDRTKAFASGMFDDNTPAVIEKIQNGIQTGADKMAEGLSGMNSAQAEMGEGVAGMDTAIAEMTAGFEGITAAMAKMQAGLDQQNNSIARMSNAGLQTAQLTAARDQLSEKLKEMAAEKEELAAGIIETKTKRAGLVAAIAEIEGEKVSMNAALGKMAALKASIPDVFEQAENDYLAKLEAMRPELDTTFKDTLNSGFRMMYVVVAVANAFALLVLMLYSSGRKEE